MIYIFIYMYHIYVYISGGMSWLRSLWLKSLEAAKLRAKDCKVSDWKVFGCKVKLLFQTAKSQTEKSSTAKPCDWKVKLSRLQSPRLKSLWLQSQCDWKVETAKFKTEKSWAAKHLWLKTSNCYRDCKVLGWKIFGCKALVKEKSYRPFVSANMKL